MKKREFLALGGAVPLALAGCGSSSSGSAEIRLVNASVGYPTQLDLKVAGTTEAADITYGSVSSYSSVGAESVVTALIDTTGTSPVTVSSQTRTLVKDSKYTLVAYGYKDAAKAVLITENQDAPDSGFASISILNTATDVGPVDVYFTTTTDISAASPTALRVSAVSASAFNSVAANTYVITIVAAGSVASNPDIRLQVSGVALASGQISTIIVVPGLGGVLASAVMVTQGGSATSFNNTKCRVKAIAATGNGGTVVVTDILSTLSPNFSSVYKQIAAGSLPVVTVNGASVAYPSGQTALVAGHDYTILVYGDSAAPLVKVIEDDNRLPSTTLVSKVRMLNAVYNNSSPLSLKLDSKSAASDVGYASASLYTEISPLTGGSSTIDVKSGFVEVLSNTVGFAAGNIYTMVLAGEELAGPDYTHVVSDFSAAR